MEKSTGPLTFAASFPLDARFAATFSELAARLASATGCAEGDSQQIREAVGAAFEQALSEGAGSSISLALYSAETGFATDVTCGARSLVHLTHPRTA